MIDQQLHKALGYILRDFIESWYCKHVSLDEEFLVQVKSKSEAALRVLAAQCKKADWLSLLTLQMVDEVIQHFRMYRQAKEKMADQTLVVDEQRSSPTMIDVDLEDVFFELEAALPQIQVMGNICSNEEAERAYLESISEMLLYLILPVEEFHSTALRYFLRDIFTCQVLLPFINTLCEPDYVNRLVVSQFKETTLTADSFQASIRMCSSVDELIELEQFTKDEIATLRRTGSSEEDHQQLGSVQYILQLCVRAREKQIAIETGQYDVEESLTQSGVNDSQRLPVVFRAEIPEYILPGDEEVDRSAIIYSLKVTCKHLGGHEEEWCVQRQFTDFKSLHALIESQVGLNVIIFPKLKDVNSTNPSKQEQCSRVLEGYLSKLLHYDIQLEYPDLLGTVVAFLTIDDYSKAVVQPPPPPEPSEPSPPSPPLTHPSHSLTRSRSDSESRREHATLVKQRKASQPVDTRKDQVEKLKMASGVAPGVNPSPSLERRSPGPSKPGMKMAKSMESIFPGQEERLTSLTFDEDDDSVPLRILMALADEVFDLKKQ
jgi:hypothetical protein